MRTWRVGIIVVTLALVMPQGGCGLGEADDFAPLTPFDNFRVVSPGAVYRSAQLDPTTFDLLFRTYEIRTVINLRGPNPGEVWYDRERAATQAAGVTLIDIPMSASRMPSREVLLLLFDALENAERPVLLHCQSGADRSGAAAAMWRMMQGATRDEALQELTLLQGHFAGARPAMTRLIAIFEPRREWIEHTYGTGTAP